MIFRNPTLEVFDHLRDNVSINKIKNESKVREIIYLELLVLIYQEVKVPIERGLKDEN
jgi:hypothetical protein